VVYISSKRWPTYHPQSAASATGAKRDQVPRAVKLSPRYALADAGPTI